jgi:polyvinyl alcohol dehydrogenase (cytochrome)
MIVVGHVPDDDRRDRRAASARAIAVRVTSRPANIVGKAGVVVGSTIGTGIIKRCLLLAIVGLLAPAGAAHADWPMYGHDLSNTRDAGSQGPSRSSLASLKPAWRFNSSTGDFTGTPVIADGVLVEGNNAGWVYALDAVTGKPRWSKDLGHSITASAAIDTAATGGAAVYVPVAQAGSPRLVALSLSNGAIRWDTVLVSHPGASVFGSPVFWHGRVYIGTSGPNDDDTTARGSVVALDEATGRRDWQTFTVPPGSDGAGVWSTPAIDTGTGRLYVGTGNNYHSPATDTEDAILALDASSGRLLGLFQATAHDTFSLPGNPLGPDFDFGASPNLITGASGQQLVGEGQKSGIYWALDRATLRPAWHASVGPSGYLGGILGSTAYDGTHVYTGDTLNGQVSALAPTGSLTWNSSDSGVIHVSPEAIANGVLYSVSPPGSLVARDPSTGRSLATISIGGVAFGGFSATGHALYVSVGTGPFPVVPVTLDGPGAIVAFGDTSASGASATTRPSSPPKSCTATGRPRARHRKGRRRHAANTRSRARAGRPHPRARARCRRRPDRAAPGNAAA